MTNQELATLADALKTRFKGEVEVERLNGNGRFRVAVVSSDFEQMTQLQRQDEIWKLVDQVLRRDATLDISLILAFAPGELAETEEAT